MVLQMGVAGPDPTGVRRRRGRFGAALAGASVVLTDQVSKAAVQPARNPGFITGWSPLSVAVVIVISIAVLVVFIGIVGRWAVQIGISPLYPALIGAGLLAHTIDRFRFGAVRDFLATGILIVDIGDLAVVAGLLGLVIAFGVRVYQLRGSSRTITLELPTLRAVIVDRDLPRAA
jgi:hypothetical protein